MNKKYYNPVSKDARLPYNPDIKYSTDNSKAKVSFKYCDNNKFELCELTKMQLKNVIAFFKKFEDMTWAEIKKDNGFKDEEINRNILNKKLPKTIPPDVTIRSIRVNNKFKILGFRDGEILRIIWFDPNHKGY